MNWLQVPCVSIWLLLWFTDFAEATNSTTGAPGIHSNNNKHESNISLSFHHMQLSELDDSKNIPAARMHSNNNQQQKQQQFAPSKITHHEANKILLNQLGLSKLRTHSSHNRKRLAVESRRHSLPDDSHMFVIKLPPNLYYYTSPKAVGNSMNSVQPDNGKKVSFNFQSNGKPGRVYHWNIPAMKKIIASKSRQSMLRSADAISRPSSTWIKPWENDTVDKSYDKPTKSITKKALKRKSPTYYAPANSISKNSFNKYFSGNGKPKGFYVIKGNHKKPSYYKNIIS